MSNAADCADDGVDDGAMEMEIDETVPNTSIIENKRISDSFKTTSTDVGNNLDIKSSDPMESKQMTSTNNKQEQESKDDDDVVVILDDTTTDKASSSRKKVVNEKTSEIKECDVINLVDKGSANSKCINYACKSGIEFVSAPTFCLNFYRVNISKRKNQEVCMQCLDNALEHYEDLAQALKTNRRLMDCYIPIRNDLVEIDDSDSEEESEPKNRLYFDNESVKLLESKFDEVITQVMDEYRLQDHCKESIEFLKKKGESVKASYLEVDTMLHDVRKKLDGIHHDLYAEFKVKYDNLPPLDITDSTPYRTVPAPPTRLSSAAAQISSKSVQEQEKKIETERRSLRKSKAISYAELDDLHSNSNSPIVVDSTFSGPKESIEAIEIPPVPADLPITGPIVKPPLKIGDYYYAARFGTMGSWVKVRLINMVKPGDTVNKEEVSEVMYYVAIESKVLTKNTNRLVNGKDIAYSTACTVMLEVGTRVIAIFRETSAVGDLKKAKRDTFYPGIIAEPLSYSNRYRYLIFFDDGYAQYVNHNMVHLIYESSKEVWKDMHSDSQPFIKKYLEAYPERPMVKLRKDQTVRTEYNGKWWLTTVTNIDCSLVQMFFDASNRVEWIYRGSTRLNPMYQEELAASARHNKNRIPRAFNETGPYVQYTRGVDDQQGAVPSAETCRSVARKSTSTQIVPANRMVPPGTVPFLPIVNANTVQPASKVVYFTPRAQANTRNLYKPHTCSVLCKNYITYDVKKLKGYNPLSKPLLCGWNRVTYKHKGKKEITYKAPCGRFLRSMTELHKYLQMTKSEMTVDLFDFDFWVHCLAEFVLERNSTINKDMSNGLENVAIPVVNYVDDKKIPFSKYSIKREPMEGVSMNLDPNFLCGCDCEDDCQDKSKCQCWLLTLQGMHYMSKNTSPENVGYIYRRLPEPVSTGIYECNPRCKCAKTCLNRVVQNPLQLKLQVFNTGNRGWGIRCLNDIPQGAFICIYAGSLLTEQEANEGGQHHGDEYFAELDYIEVVEKMKEDYEDDVVMDEDDDKKSKEESADEEELNDMRNGRKRSDDPMFIPSTHFPKGKHNPIYKTRSRANESGTKRKKSDDSDDETVTISDDEDGIREPSSFNPKNGEDLDESRPSMHKSVRQMYGDDECVYIMDAKVSGNIGRFLNHSCSPNVFVQNVFVDTHDLRFPWVAFFALTYIRAGTELTWNYNYDIGSVPGKMLHCYCGSDDCRGRLL